MSDSVYYKAVGADLDGTLLPSDKILSPYTLNIVDKLRKRDVLFFPVTGKALSLTRRIFHGHTMPMVCLDGALIHLNGNNIWDPASLIPPSIASHIIDMSVPLPIFAMNNDRVCTCGDVTETQYGNWGHISGGSLKESDLARVTSIIILCTRREPLEDLKKKIFKEYSPGLDGYLTPVEYRAEFSLVIKSINLSKLNGVKKLLGYQKMDVDRMMFFGDWLNDIRLLQKVGFPIVMRNAEKEVMTHGRAVTLYTNDENGVARFLEEYYRI